MTPSEPSPRALKAGAQAMPMPKAKTKNAVKYLANASQLGLLKGKEYF